MSKKKKDEWDSTEFDNEVQVSETNTVSEGEVTTATVEEQLEIVVKEQPETVIEVVKEVETVEEVSPIADTIKKIEEIISPAPLAEGEFADDDIVTYRLRGGGLAYGKKSGIVKLGYKPIEKYIRPTK